MVSLLISSFPATFAGCGSSLIRAQLVFKLLYHLLPNSLSRPYNCFHIQYNGVGQTKAKYPPPRIRRHCRQMAKTATKCPDQETAPPHNCSLRGNAAQKGQRKKHCCPDCLSCQLCSDSRCHLCQKEGQRKKKMNIEDQILLYDRLNKGLMG